MKSLLPRILACLFALLVFGLSAFPIHAQFNGPADTARDTVNAPHPITTDPAILYPASRAFKIHIGDQLKVSIYGVPDYVAQDRVSTEGKVSLPLLDLLEVRDLTLVQAQELIAKRLIEAEIFRDPQVRIDVLDSPASVITVLGETRAVVPSITGTRKLFEVLAAAGGIAAPTSHVISIDRPGMAESINVDLGTDPEQSKYANIPLFSGDTVTTSRIGSYYLLGAFKQQGAVPLTNTAPLTLMQVIASGGGKLWEAKLHEIHVIRTTGTTRTVVIVDLQAALDGKGPDPVIQADDIIFAPTVKWKAAIRSGGLSTAFGLALTLYAVSTQY